MPETKKECPTSTHRISFVIVAVHKQKMPALEDNAHAKQLEALPSDDFVHAFPRGTATRASAIASFVATLTQNEDQQKDKCGVKVSRAKSLAFWRQYRRLNPAVTDGEVRSMQRAVAAARKRAKRLLDQKNGVSSTGNLLADHSWRRLNLGDHVEGSWSKKLSFVPVVKIASFGTKNLFRLHNVHERLVELVRLRGGGRKTNKHQTGKSLGRTVMSGGRVSRELRRANPTITHVSGTIQLAKLSDSLIHKEAIETVTACVEEAFGNEGWYKVAKQCFSCVPHSRRLPHSSLPASNIWWSWNSHHSAVHINSNTLPPCFVLCPYTYNGAELLIGESERKIPLSAGRVVGGSWQRFPHCNGELLSEGDRYSFMAYFNYRMLNPSFLTK